MSVYCEVVRKKYLALIVDNIILCDSYNNKDSSSCKIGCKAVVLVEQSSGLIVSVQYGGLDTASLPNDEQIQTQIITFPPGSTLLPGFIDCHVHLTIGTDDYQLDHLRLSSADKALRALKSAQSLLQVGFTTIRTAGDADVYYPSFALARSIASGDFVGPRIVGAGHYISVTGGGGDINFMSPDNCGCCSADGLIANGKDEMIKAVRTEIKYGSTWIKVLATGAFMSASTNDVDSPENSHFSQEELEAVVQEAARRKVPVMAHAHGAEGIQMAARAGVRSVEHASFIDAAGINACLENNTWIVPTFAIGAYFDSKGSETGAQDRMIEIQKTTNERYYSCMKRAIAADVRVALGSDYVGFDDAGFAVREFEYLVNLGGMTPQQAIYTGTASAAELLKMDNLGKIVSGFIADIVVVQGNPLENIACLRTGVCFVMKQGEIVRNFL